MSKTSREKIAVVVPCFNEAKRLNGLFFENMTRELGCNVVFVNDGSTDETLNVLYKICSNDRMSVINLVENGGKAAALKAGLQRAEVLNMKFAVACDADQSNSIEDIQSLVQVLLKSDHVDIASAARVPLAGSDVQRKTSRKWAGRIVATLLGNVTNITIYDPMSPLKAYRLSSLGILDYYKPRTKWFGEIELLRFIYAARNENFCLVEVPMHHWRDKAGGHLGIRSFFAISLDYIRLRVSLLFEYSNK